MAAVLEVSLGEIKETVKRDRCDWLAAIYNLLIDQPEGRIAMNKLLCNAEKDSSELSSADPFDGSGSGFSQNLSQGMARMCTGVYSTFLPQKLFMNHSLPLNTLRGSMTPIITTVLSVPIYGHYRSSTSSGGAVTQNKLVSSPQVNGMVMCVLLADLSVIC